MMNLLFGFNGRIRRLHYWLASLGAGLSLSVFYLLVFMILLAVARSTDDFGATMSSPPIIIALLLLTTIYLVFAFWISLAVQIKRWHDRDKSGVWVLIAFIPVVGGLWSLIECGFLDGTEGPNRFGPSPKGVTGPPPVRV
ncbi:MAG TPA: DUF805 domain-containing protein [Caulobacteraceae bacterium]|nr:DUF805 domain-containing protein [Caulobacteraceae bacterium]